MKRLILVRHAKSDWPEDTDDFHRPLTEKGSETARKMGRFLADQNLEIEQLISSDALRAKTTALLMNETFHLPLGEDHRLYNPAERNFASVLFDLSDEITSVALFSHNNGISNFANSLTEEALIFPTSGVAVFEIDTDRWAVFEGKPARLRHFFRPKELFKDAVD